MPFRFLPEGGEKDAVDKKIDDSSPTGLQIYGPLTRLREGGIRNEERETIFIMERSSLTGKHNYGQSVTQG